MLKDLVASLQQGTAQIKGRMSMGASTLNQYGQANAMAASAMIPSDSGMPSLGPSGSKTGNKVGNTSYPAGTLGKFLKAIAQQESGGNYGAIGVQTSSGTALGKYQILDSNFVKPGGWDKEALGRDVSRQQYLNNPKIQEQIARHKLTSYFKQYGARGAAKAWYAGPGNWNTNSDSSQYGGPSINDYAAQVLGRM